MNKWLILFILLLLPCVCAEEVEMGDFLVVGEFSDQTLTDLSFYDRFVEDFDDDEKNVITLSNIGEEIVVTIDGFQGIFDEENILSLTVIGDYAYIYVVRGEQEDLYEFEEGVSLAYNVYEDYLEIYSGRINVNGVWLDVTDSFYVRDGIVFSEEPIDIEGIGSVKGAFSVDSRGVTLHSEYGSSNYLGDDFVIHKGAVLLPYSLDSVRSYEGAYFYYGDGELKARSVEGCFFSYWPSEDEILDLRYKKEQFSMAFQDTAEIYVANREKGDQTPLLQVFDGEGFIFKNGAFQINGEGQVLDVSDLYFGVEDQSTLNDALGFEHSVPMRIQFDDFDMVISATNSYVTEDVEGNQLFTFNNLDLPITDSFSQNDLRTVEQLREKWPDMIFNVDSNYGSETPSATSLQLIDKYLQEYPDRIVQEFVLSAENYDSSALYSKQRITFEDPLGYLPENFDNNPLISSPDREFKNNPYQILVHEHNHLDVYDVDQSGKYGFDEGTLMYEYNQLALTMINYIQEDERIQEVKSSFRSLSSTEESIYGLFQKSVEEVRAGGNIDNLQIVTSVVEEYGVPAVYALRPSSLSSGAHYPEMSTTYIEEPIEQRRERAHSSNPKKKIVYQALTQLAFDSGQITLSECNYIMGFTCECGVYWPNDATLFELHSRGLSCNFS